MSLKDKLLAVFSARSQKEMEREAQADQSRPLNRWERRRYEPEARVRSMASFDRAFSGILPRPARRRLAAEALRRFHKTATGRTKGAVGGSS